MKTAFLKVFLQVLLKSAMASANILILFWMLNYFTVIFFFFFFFFLPALRIIYLLSKLEQSELKSDGQEKQPADLFSQVDLLLY